MGVRQPIMKPRQSRIPTLAFQFLTLCCFAPILLVACAGSPETEDRVFVVGLVTNNPNGLRNVQGFRDGMAELGYIEGENINYLFEGTPTSADRLEAVLGSMVEAQVDLIFTAGTPTGVAAYSVTQGTGIPVVFGVIADPIAAGVMTDLMRPGGTITGVKISENQDRRLELLKEIAPHITRVFVPHNPDDTAASTAVAQIIAIAPDLGIQLVIAEARNDQEVTEMLQTIPEELDAVFLVPDSVVNARLQDILAFAVDQGLPVSGPTSAQVEEGALTSYGIIHHAAGSQAARIADRILRGADPGNLPVETAEFYLAINLHTAEAIGLTIPEPILQQSEIVILP